MRLSETREIDGQSFTVQQLPAMRALKLLHRLSKAGGALLSETPDLARALNAFSEDDLERTAKELLETATAQTEGKITPVVPQFDVLFRGRVATLLKLLAFALQVNYADFYGALAGKFAAALTRASASGSADSTPKPSPAGSPTA